MRFAESITNLIEEFMRLPGIGRKTAQRFAFHILKNSRQESEKLAKSIIQVKKKISYCSICSNITEVDPCLICSNGKRDGTVICVVEEPTDALAIEETGEYQGLYHVLLGSLSPLEGIGPNDIKIKELLSRLQKGTVKEIIIATNPNVEGEATAMYISKVVKPMNIKITRIGRGIPIGGNLEYTDAVTLTKALEGRKDF